MRLMEELSLNAWPSLETLYYDGWILRFANGYTKRANSVNPLYASAEDLSRKIQVCEEYYNCRKLPTIFKMTGESTPTNLDIILETNGYERMDNISVQVIEINENPAICTDNISVTATLSDDWLHSYCTMNGVGKDHQGTLRLMLERIVPTRIFVLLYWQERVVACGLGVLERDFMGLFDIVVEPELRGQGFGEQLIHNMVKIAKEKGIGKAYLQVMRNNVAAMRLYDKVGFKEVYQYWYRVKTVS